MVDSTKVVINTNSICLGHNQLTTTVLDYDNECIGCGHHGRSIGRQIDLKIEKLVQ